MYTLITILYPRCSLSQAGYCQCVLFCRRMKHQKCNNDLKKQKKVPRAGKPRECSCSADYLRKCFCSGWSLAFLLLLHLPAHSLYLSLSFSMRVSVPLSIKLSNARSRKRARANGDRPVKMASHGGYNV